jgi:hypothetical protein
MELLFKTVLCNPLLGSCNSWTTTMEMGVFLCGPCQGVILKTAEVTQLVKSHPVKRRLGGWCEMATSLGVSQLSVSW